MQVLANSNTPKKKKKNHTPSAILYIFSLRKTLFGIFSREVDILHWILIYKEDLCHNYKRVLIV